jgi:meiotically up-regulated gene 157 (Mug157) protein
VHERKYELDSLAYVLRFARGYVAATGDTSFVDDDWFSVLRLILDTVELGQAGSNEPRQLPYRFQRRSLLPSETLANDGAGWPARRCGLSQSPFRPSDDAAQLPFPIAANAMMAVELRHTAEWLSCIPLAGPLRDRAGRLASEIDGGIRAHGMTMHPKYGLILAYEIDGFGSVVLMDDANIPSLLSLPYLGWIDAADPVYQATRAAILSEDNPWWFCGTQLSGIGSPHVTEQKSGQSARRRVWPLALCKQALTSREDEEILHCISQLRTAGRNTGFMHESVACDDVTVFSRPWFGWANALFGELVSTLVQQRPHLLALKF